jgi:hypothetical protein
VRRRSPRLDSHCRRLSEEHVTILEQIGTVQNALGEGTAETRTQVLELLRLLVRHRQHGADLVYEAYAVDIGGSE